jgi:probable rRNA maturation factor
MRQSPSVQFHFDKVSSVLRDRKKLKVFLRRLTLKEKKYLGTLNYIFCSDGTLLEINRKYLNHNFYTDVISFDLASSPKEIFAEIYISIDRVRENAKALKLPFRKELHRVMFHGLLHLCGYKDKTRAQQIEMKEKEDYYLNRYFRTFHESQFR